MNREHENRRDDPAAFSRLARMFLWVDDMRNVNRLVWMLVTLRVVLGLLDFAYHKHVEFPIEEFPAFYGLYGFFMCAGLVVAAKGLRMILMRREDYYAPRSVEAEEHPEFDLGREDFDA